MKSGLTVAKLLRAKKAFERSKGRPVPRTTFEREFMDALIQRFILSGRSMFVGKRKR